MNGYYRFFPQLFGYVSQQRTCLNVLYRVSTLLLLKQIISSPAVLNWIHFTEKNGFVTATKLGTINNFFVAATKNFAAATKRFVDRTKHFVVVTGGIR